VNEGRWPFSLKLMGVVEGEMEPVPTIAKTAYLFFIGFEFKEVFVLNYFDFILSKQKVTVWGCLNSSQNTI
jgi:hypothetical protein